MTNCIFSAKTRDGYVIKILAELLQSNIKTACFEIDEKGLKLCMMDNNRTILINLDLDADKFNSYKYRKEGKLYIGINLSHFHKMLKSIKKKDTVQFFIEESSPNDLHIKVTPKENNRTTTSCVKIQGIQNLDIDLPSGYSKPIIVPASEYQKMIKSMLQISNSINITSKGFLIKFNCNAGGVMKRSTNFGEVDPDESDTESSTGEYNAEFDTDQLSRITKMAGLSSNLQIYATEGLPLLFKSDVGQLGKLSIYIKSKSEIEHGAVEEAN